MIAVSAAQFSPSRNRAANLAEIGQFAEAAARQGAEVVVFPEYSAWFPGELTEEAFGNAEALDGPFVSALRHMASERGVTIVAGMLEHIGDPDPRPYNTVVAVGPDGRLLSTYRKLHLYDAFGSEESRWIRPGPLDQEPIFEHAGLVFGLQTCYDLRFPEASRVLTDAGASVLLLPAQWVPGPMKERHWSTLLRARAIENTAYVVAADHGPPFGVGLSSILDPTGRCIDTVDEAEGLATAFLSPEMVHSVRNRNPSLCMRRYTVTACS